MGKDWCLHLKTSTRTKDKRKARVSLSTPSPSNKHSSTPPSPRPDEGGKGHDKRTRESRDGEVAGDVTREGSSKGQFTPCVVHGCTTSFSITSTGHSSRYSSKLPSFSSSRSSSSSYSSSSYKKSSSSRSSASSQYALQL